jgi:outer membrane lipoprotein-sorting protein
MSERERRSAGTSPAAGEEPWLEERLRALFAAADPPVRAPDALRRRVAARPVAVTAPRRSGRGRTALRIGLGLTTATALALVYTVLAPVWTAAKMLSRAEAAERAATSGHTVVWRIWPDGTRTKVSETWSRGSRWRSLDVGEGRVRVHADGKLWIYQPKFNKVTVFKEADSPGNDLTQLTRQALVRGASRSGYRLRLLGDAMLHGRRVHRLVLEWRREPMRGLLLVDAATDLPVQAELQLQRGGQWVTEQFHEFRFNEPLPAGLFRPEFPKSAPVFDRDQGRQEWGRRLASGIAQQRVGGRTLVIRDLQVNAEGDLFLLYTAGKYPGDNLRTHGTLAGRDWDVKVKDEVGTVYRWQPGNWTSDKSLPPQYRTGWVFNGERLEGDWWVSLKPQIPWKARRITITFRVPPVNRHGAALVPHSYTETATFTLPVKSPATEVVPDYMALLWACPQEQELPVIRARARGFYYQYEQPDLPRSLEYYRQVIRLREAREKETGEHMFDSQAWLDVGKVLRAMGRMEEARAAFQQAVREAVQSYQRPEAEATLEACEGEIAWSPGRKAPSFTATDLKGLAQSPQQYRGRVLLIHLWSTWDGNNQGRADLPELVSLHEKYRGQGLAILGVGIHDDPAKLQAVIDTRNLVWPQIGEPHGWNSKLYRSFGAPKIPYTILVDREGTIRALGLHGPALEKAVAELMVR